MFSCLSAGSASKKTKAQKMILIDLTLNTPQNLVPGQGGAVVKSAGKLLPAGKETLGTELPGLPRRGKAEDPLGP